MGPLFQTYMGACRSFAWTWGLEFTARDRQKCEQPYLNASFNDIFSIESTSASEVGMNHE
jgi:hypothetical protein